MTRKLLPIIILVLVSGSAWAQSFDMDDAPVVRRQLKWRAGRSELMPRFGITANDPYFRNFIVSLGYNYHLNNWLSFGVNAGWSFPLKTGLTENVEQEKSLPGKSYSMPATYLGLVSDVHVGLVPFYGKMLLFGNTALAYDFHVLIGAGFIQVRWNSEAAHKISAEDKFAVAPTFGAGFRLFVDPGVAVSLDVVDHLALMNVNALPDYTVPGEEWTHNVAVMLSFSIMFPYQLSYEE